MDSNSNITMQAVLEHRIEKVENKVEEVNDIKCQMASINTKLTGIIWVGGLIGAALVGKVFELM